MTITDTALLELIHELSPASRESVRDFAEYLVAKERQVSAQQAEVKDRSDAFFALAGSISDPTFVRPPQGEAEDRLTLE